MKRVRVVPESGEVLTHYLYMFNRTYSTCCQIKIDIVAYLGVDHHMFNKTDTTCQQVNLGMMAYLGASFADLAAMGAGVSTDGMRVAGVPVGIDAWVKNFVAKKAQSVITDRQIGCCLGWASSQSAAQFLPKCAHGLPWA